jgi:hypothetical protein
MINLEWFKYSFLKPYKILVTFQVEMNLNTKAFIYQLLSFTVLIIIIRF